jgi:mono/diheme cytochrome c family protein
MFKLMAAATLGLLATTLAAEAAADAVNGERVARRWCAECHVVAPDQKAASADVPAFAAIAANPKHTDASLTTLLQAPDLGHSRMQNLGLSRTDIADVVAYIRRLAP